MNLLLPFVRPALRLLARSHFSQTAAFLLCLVCLQSNAGGIYQDKVTLHLKDVSLESALKEVAKQTESYYSASAPLLQPYQHISVNLTDASLDDALKAILSGKPLGYTLIGKEIVITKKNEVSVTAAPGQPTSQPQGAPKPLKQEVHGHIVGPDGKAMEGVNVTIAGTNEVVATDKNGNFTLFAYPDAKLEITHIGYERVEYDLEGNSKEVHLKLQSSTTSLVDIVIDKGPYQTTFKNNVGDVSVVSGKEISSQPTSNTLLALQAYVPGLYITQQSGLPGTAVQTLIQGQNSITNGNDPFYVVDGVPYQQELLPNLGYVLGMSGTGSLTSSYGSPFSYLNPEDIESVSILKDADATAIYGSRAANGAIIITTRKGRPGKTKINFNLSDGFGQVTHMLPVLNTKQYLEMRHEAFLNHGTQPSIAEGDYDLLFWDTTSYTNWEKVFIGGTSHYSSYSMSISGGNDQTQYLLSGNYHRETTVFPTSFSDQKGSVHFNINSSSENKKFNVILSGEYLFDNNHLPSTDYTYNAIILPPDAPSLYNADGSLNWALNSSGTSTWPNQTNLIAGLANTYQTKGNNLVSNLKLSYNILNDLIARVNCGYTNLAINEFSPGPLSALAPSLRPYSENSSVFQYNNANTWIIEPQLDYNHNFSKNRIELLVGGTINRNHGNANSVGGLNYSSDLLLQDLADAATIIPLGSTISEYRYAALYGRANYTYNEKYILNLTARRDGSSRFGEDNQYHNFGAIGIGWLFTQENLIKHNFHFLSFGKLRGSYGTTGNDQIGDYQYLATYNPNFSVTNPYQSTSSLVPTGLPNPYLQWEETKKLSVGIDLGFYNDRILIDGTYFQNRSSNQLLYYNLPFTTGYPSIATNFPANVQNSGEEITLHLTNIKNKYFNWTSIINLTIPKNKLISFPNLSSSSYANSLIIGKSIHSLRLYNYAGVNDTTGLYQFRTSEGTTTSSPEGIKDATIILNTDPKYFGNIANTFSYKGIEVTFNFYYVNKISGTDYFGFSVPGQQKNQPTTVMNRWKTLGDQKSIQKFNSTTTGVITPYRDVTQSNAYYTGASFVRLKNASLGWHIPITWTSKAKLASAIIFMQAENLATITNFHGLDPETGNLSLPPLRVITFGLNATF